MSTQWHCYVLVALSRSVILVGFHVLGSNLGCAISASKFSSVQSETDILFFSFFASFRIPIIVALQSEKRQK
jgi:hypothetical protein